MPVARVKRGRVQVAELASQFAKPAHPVLAGRHPFPANAELD
jgi:hypothetical protein